MGMFAVDARGLRQHFDGAAGIAEVGARKAKLVMCVCGIRQRPHQRLKDGQRFSRLALHAQGGAQQEKRLRVAGRDLQDFARLLGRKIGPWAEHLRGLRESRR